jgi:hypothetical protein
MPRKEICIIGSCATRDAWRVAGASSADVTYIARTGFASLMAPPIKIDWNGMHIDSAFQRKCIFRDATKWGLAHIRRFKPNFIVIDFIDERFDLVRVDASYLTLSHELTVSGFAEKASSSCTVLHRLSEEVTHVWERAAVKFCKFLKEMSPQSQVILHKARWAESYVKHGERHIFGADDPSGEKRRLIMRHNALLESYYAFFCEVASLWAVIAPADDLVVAEYDHLWGRSPFHFIDAYYTQLFHQIRQITSGADRPVPEPGQIHPWSPGCASPCSSVPAAKLPPRPGIV